jgi:hypothetical protein
MSNEHTFETSARDEMERVTREALVKILLDVLVTSTDGSRYDARWLATTVGRFTVHEADPDVENGCVILVDGRAVPEEARWPSLTLPKPREVAEAYANALPEATRRYRRMWDACEDALLELE